MNCVNNWWYQGSACITPGKRKSWDHARLSPMMMICTSARYVHLPFDVRV